MKRYLFALLLFFAGSAVYAQSVAFGDLLNLTSMAGAPSHDLLLARGFKSAGPQTFSGKTYDQFTKVVKGSPDGAGGGRGGAGGGAAAGGGAREGGDGT